MDRTCRWTHFESTYQLLYFRFRKLVKWYFQRKTNVCTAHIEKSYSLFLVTLLKFSLSVEEPCSLDPAHPLFHDLPPNQVTLISLTMRDTDRYE